MSAHTTVIFGIRIHSSFSQPSENFSPRSSQIRSPGQAKWPYDQKYLLLRHSFRFRGSICDSQKFIRASVPTKFMHQYFDCYDLRSGDFGDLIIMRQWEYVQIPLIPKVQVEGC